MKLFPHNSVTCRPCYSLIPSYTNIKQPEDGNTQNAVAVIVILFKWGVKCQSRRFSDPVRSIVTLNIKLPEKKSSVIAESSLLTDVRLDRFFPQIRTKAAKDLPSRVYLHYILLDIAEHLRKSQIVCDLVITHLIETQLHVIEGNKDDIVVYDVSSGSETLRPYMRVHGMLRDSTTVKYTATESFESVHRLFLRVGAQL
ncbi:hypothetical protein PROFUN_14994 [Planoprotostelium fungivorum]|uniref:Uncharacterized protein n=1 Tax=Planoprotostelium fungivorum TaxID=1890364 RepID=A0A2P6MY25_9EUKA|nr:hypothetical protein PROFUN_14994 [Planoprotostelium fungivorum]